MSVKNMWDESAGRERREFGDTLPDGKYVAEVIKCEFGQTRDGKDKVHWDLKVVAGPHAGNHIFIHRTFFKTDTSEQNKKAINTLLDDFINLRLPCRSHEIGASMNSIIGKNVIVELSPMSNGNGQFRNIRDMAPVGGTVVDNDPEIPF